MSEVERHWSGGLWESAFGYCRAVRAGDLVLVSGCTSEVDGVVLHRGDPAAQLRVAAETALEAVAHFGGTAADVVRTRMYVTHHRDSETVGRAHQAVFGAAPPAATMVIVAALLHPDMRVELEVEAFVPTRRPRPARCPPTAPETRGTEGCSPAPGSTTTAVRPTRGSLNCSTGARAYPRRRRTGRSWRRPATRVGSCPWSRLPLA